MMTEEEKKKSPTNFFSRETNPPKWKKKYWKINYAIYVVSLILILLSYLVTGNFDGLGEDSSPKSISTPN